MTGGISFSSSIINNSIVNSDIPSHLTKDNVSPFSFLEFITNTNVDYSPEQYNNFYINYLKDWSEIKRTKETNKITFIDLYVNFLKEVTLTYSTQQELRFLSSLDFKNPIDLDIAIPFYVEKIRQIILFYKEKRDIGKYAVDRNKIKGTQLSVEKILFDKIYDYIFSTEDNPNYTAIGYSLSTLQTHLKIDIGEFVDVYGEYFDLPRTTDEFTRANTNDIDASLFFDDPNSIFRNEIFLREVPLAVNTAINYDNICDPTNPQLLLENDCLNKSGLTTDQRIGLRRQLLRKYAGADFHYIDTTGATPVSGVLFRAENPTGNIQNLQAIDTPTIESNEIKLLRDIGIFFKPEKTGLFQLNAPNYTFEINTALLEADKIYIYPDPSVYGNVSVNKQLEYPIVFTYDFRKENRNISSSFATGDPKINSVEPTFAPYYSREQTILKQAATDSGFYLNFGDLYNEGYIVKHQTDIYGNEYALFKDRFGQTFKTIQELDREQVLSLELDGHVFYDYNEGFNFDYSIASEEGSFIRSGISTTTVDGTEILNGVSVPLFSLSGFPYSLYFREFTPYIELSDARGITTNTARSIIGAIRDCATFTFSDGTPLPDPISSIEEEYPGDDIYYYTTLAEAGIVSINPITYAKKQGPITTETPEDILTESDIVIVANDTFGDFTVDIRPLIRTNNAEDYDCGYFTDEVTIQNDYNYSLDYRYYSEVEPSSMSVVSNLTGNDSFKLSTTKREFEGKMFIKNQAFSESSPVSSALNVIFNKYPDSVTDEVYNKVKDFEVYYDTLVIETNNNLIFDKIEYQDMEFESPSTKNTYFTKDSKFNVFSNRFFKEREKTIDFCTLTLGQQLSSQNAKYLYPSFYTYDIITNNIIKKYPKQTDTSTLSSLFSLSSFFANDYNFNLIKVDKPRLSYNSFNNIYKCTFTGVDNNNLFHIFDYEFYIVGNDVTISTVKYYKHSKDIKTTNFSLTGTDGTIFCNINPISGSYAINTNKGELSI